MDPGAPALALPRSLRHRFRPRRLLGKGTSGTVILAHDHELDRPVAVKLLTADLERFRDLAARFRQEATLAAAVRHPNLVQVYDFGGGGKEPLYILYQFVGGRDLAAYLEAPERPDPAQAIEWIRQLADALGALHDAGLIHRDVKPANILIDPGGHPYLIDLGLARAPERTGLQTKSGVLIGTPLYMAPEVWRLERATPQADQFGLAAVLHECLYGRSPYPFVRIEDLLGWCEEEDEELAISEPGGDHPPSVRPALVRALRRSPKQRFSHVRDFARALAGEIPAEPHSPPTRAREPTPRTPQPAPPAEAGAGAGAGASPRRLARPVMAGLFGLGLALGIAMLGPRAPVATPDAPSAPSPPAPLPEDPAREIEARLRRAYTRLLEDHPRNRHTYAQLHLHLEEVVPWALDPETRARWDFTLAYLTRYLEADRARPHPAPQALRRARERLVADVVPGLLHAYEDVKRLEKNARERLAGLSLDGGPVRPGPELREMADLGEFVRTEMFRWLDALRDRARAPSDMELLVAARFAAETGWPGSRWILPLLANRPRGATFQGPDEFMNKVERRLFYSNELAGMLGCEPYVEYLGKLEELAAQPASSRSEEHGPWSIQGFLMALRHFGDHGCRTPEDAARLERMLALAETDLRIDWTQAVRLRACQDLRAGNGQVELLKGANAPGATPVIQRFRILLEDRCGGGP